MPAISFTPARQSGQHPRVSRLDNDPDRYIRVVKGGKYQARPIDLGERFDLGLFHTRHAARAALNAFWWGKRPSLPKYTKLCHTKAGDRYIVLVPNPARPGHYLRVGSWYETREEAGRIARRWICRRYGARADDLLKRRG